MGRSASAASTGGSGLTLGKLQRRGVLGRRRGGSAVGAPRRKEISKELYEFCLDQSYADRNLIAKWKKPGYERLCCLRCIQTRDHNFATTCVCRVPKHLREEKVIECVHCGCKGCASGD
ncbi:hypothetical protein ABZP36_025171 [Zizania latifolia]